MTTITLRYFDKVNGGKKIIPVPNDVADVFIPRHDPTGHGHIQPALVVNVSTDGVTVMDVEGTRLAYYGFTEIIADAINDGVQPSQKESDLQPN